MMESMSSMSRRMESQQLNIERLIESHNAMKPKMSSSMGSEYQPLGSYNQSPLGTITSPLEKDKIQIYENYQTVNPMNSAEKDLSATTLHLQIINKQK